MFNQIKTLLSLERSKASEISETTLKTEEKAKEKNATAEGEGKKEVKGNGFLLSQKS